MKEELLALLNTNQLTAVERRWQQRVSQNIVPLSTDQIAGIIKQRRVEDDGPSGRK